MRRTFFKEANEAFEVLSDKDKRARYDKYGHSGVDGQTSAGGADFGDMFGDIFGDIFGGAAAVAEVMYARAPIYATTST